jgi:uncharacterized protein
LKCSASKLFKKTNDSNLTIEFMTTQYYVLLYKTVADYLERRTEFRPEHLRLVTEAHLLGTLMMAGAFSDPADSAMFIFKGSDSKIAEDFAKNDPYVKNGLITEWNVRPWAVAIGAF